MRTQEIALHVAVLGAGVIGTSVAYFLARSGHRVTVVERQPGAGLETSFANAGEVSPGYSAPWAGPGVPVKAICISPGRRRESAGFLQ